MSQSLLKIAADFTVQLASAVAIGDTTATLSSISDDDSVSLPSGLYGFTIDNGQSNKEYIICNLSGTALTNIQSISRQGSLTTGFVRTHRRGAKVSITDWAILKRILDNLNGTTGFDSSTNLGYDGTPTGLTGNQFATVNYVLSVVNGGSVTFDKQVISNQVAGENLTANDIVYFKEADQKWWKADANAITPSTRVKLGIAGSTVVTDTTVQIYISGPINTFTGLTAGSQYYLSDTAGGISTAEGSNPILIGWALSTTTILLDTTDKVLPMGSLSTTVNPENILIEDNASAASTDQTQTTQNGTVEVGEADTTLKKNKIAQSFIPERTKIRGVNLYKIADSGTFTGTVTISIQADSSGSPSGSALASKVYTNAQWVSVSVGDFEALFSSEISLTIGSTYWIVIETSTSDDSNHPNVGSNTAGGYTKGSVKYKNTTDNWTAIATIDLYFKTLEGNNSQLVKTNSSGKIPEGLFRNSFTKLVGVGEYTNNSYENYQVQYGAANTTWGWTSTGAPTYSNAQLIVGPAQGVNRPLGVDIATGALYTFANQKIKIIEWDARIVNDTATAISYMGIGINLNNMIDALTFNREGVGFYTDASGNWYIYRGNSTNNTTTSITKPSAGRHTFRIEYNPSTPIASFYIDGVLVGTHTSGLPTSSDIGLSFCNGATSTIISALSSINVAIEK